MRRCFQEKKTESYICFECFDKEWKIDVMDGHLSMPRAPALAFQLICERKKRATSQQFDGQQIILDRDRMLLLPGRQEWLLAAAQSSAAWQGRKW